MNDRRADIWCVLLLIALPTALFADVLFLGSNFFIRDLYRYHYPMKRAVRDTIAQGEFPYWNRAFASGQPMAANPAYEIFYPPQWLIFAGPYPLGFALHILLHIDLALLGMYAFLRTLPLARPAAFAGALSFGMGGLLLGTMTNLPTFFVWSWAGLGGWAVVRLLRVRSRGRFTVAAIVLVMPMLVAEPMALAQLWALIVIGAFMLDRRALPVIALLAVATALLAAVQLVPMFDLLPDSARARGFSYDVMTDYSASPLRPIELVTPHAFGVPNPNAHAFWGGRIFPRGLPYLVNVYCGLFVAIFAIGGLLARVRGTAAFLAVAAASYVLAIGSDTPLFRALHAVGVRAIRYPEKFAAMGIVAMIVFAAHAADRLLAGDDRVRRGALFAGAAIALLLVVTSIVFRLPDDARLTWIARHSFLTSAAFAGAWMVLLWRARSSRAWLLGAMTLLFADLLPFANEVAPRMPREFFTPPAVVSALRPGATIVHRGEWMTDDSTRQQLEHLASNWLARDALRPFTPAAWGLRSALDPDVDETFLLPTHDLLDAFRKSRGSGSIIARTGADYVIDWAHPPTPPPIIVRRAPSPGPYRSTARILVVRETANTATIDVQALSPATLLMLVTRHKYWHVTIDGREARIAPANIAFQAVTVPTGRHRVEMRYRNRLIGWGAAVSAATLLALVVPGAARLRKRTG